MSVLTDRDAQVQYLVHQLKRRVFAGSSVMLGLAMAITIFMSRYQLQHTATNYTESVRNFLTIGDLRSAMGILKGSLTSDFSRVSYVNSSQKTVFSLENSSVDSVKSQWHKLTTAKLTQTLGASNSQRRLVFEYSWIKYFPSILLSWMIVNGLFLQASRSFEKNLQSYFKIVLDRQRLTQIGEISRQIGHDIRSPLSALKVATANLEGIDSDRKLLITGATKRIFEMADGLLGQKQAGPFQSSQSKMSNSHWDISELLQKSCNEKLITMAKDGPSLNVKITPGPVMIEMDPMVFQRIVSNLLNNALESVQESPQGQVNVSLQSSKEMALLVIEDNGTGIPDEVLNQLGKHIVSDSKENIESAGSGVGVLHAYREIKGWRGTIAHRNNQDQGASVIITLPLSKGE